MKGRKVDRMGNAAMSDPEHKEMRLESCKLVSMKVVFGSIPNGWKHPESGDV